jgi:hypothetical protein
MTFGEQAQPKMARALGDDFFGAKDWLAHHACLANKFWAGLPLQAMLHSSPWNFFPRS